MTIVSRIMRDYRYNLDEALTMPLPEVFVLYTCAAVADGNTMTVPYEAEDRLDEARKSGRRIVML